METGDPGTPGGDPQESGAPSWPAPPGGAWPATPGVPPAPPPVPPGYPPNAAPGVYWQGGAPSPAGGLRPHGVGELLDGAFTLYRRNFLLFAAIVAVVQVPFALLTLLIYEVANISGSLTDIRSLTTFIQQGNTLSDTQLSQLHSDVGTLFAYFAAVFVLQYLVVYPLSQAATTTAVSARYLDQPASVRQSYAAALTRWRALIAMVLWLVLVVGGPVAVALLVSVASGSTALLGLFVVAILVFYIIVLVRTTVAPQAVVLERLRGWPGIRRSFRLTEHSAWRVFGIRLLLLLIQAIAAGVIILPVSAVFSGATTTTQDVASQVAQAVIAVFIAPVTLVTLTLLYYDLRIRREGFDIEMLAASL